MTGLSSTMLNIMGRSAATAPVTDRSFKFNLPGNVPDVTFCDGTCKDAKTLDTNTGGGKWMYDQAAKSFDYNPVTARKTPAQNAKVLDRMYTSINAAIDATKARGKNATSVEWHSQFRTSLGTVRDTQERSATQMLNQQQRLASLPGAATLADPALRELVQSAVNLEARVALAIDPKLGAVQQASLTTGATIAILAADQLAPSLAAPPAITDPGLEPLATQQSEQKPLTPLALPLDTDHDGKLMCKEIGDWVPDTSSHSANSRAYQDYVTGRAATDFHVVSPTAPRGTVKFDGCKDQPAGPMLLEAKGDHGRLLGGGWSEAETKNIPLQGKNQNDAAKALGVQNEWHVQTSNDFAVIKDIFDNQKLNTPVHHTPMKTSDK